MKLKRIKRIFSVFLTSVLMLTSAIQVSAQAITGQVVVAQNKKAYELVITR